MTARPGASVPRVQRTDHGTVVLCSPTVGVWVAGPEVGGIVTAGQSLGHIDVLGRRTTLTVPAGVGGRVIRRPGERCRTPVDFGAVLLELDPAAGVFVEGAVHEDVVPGVTAEGGALLFRAPMSGRVYRRPSPGEPPFVEAGTSIEHGHTVCLLEVMKTFNRVVYQGSDLPARARVVRVLVDDGVDVAADDPLLELETPSAS